MGDSRRRVDTIINQKYLAETTICSDASLRQNVIVALDEEPPVPSIAITDFSTDGASRRSSSETTL
jgi:hypothetical protein